MQRYTVNIILPDDIDGGPPTTSLIIPCNASSLVTALLHSILVRLDRRGYNLSTTTHEVHLHLTSADGPLIDPDDLLSDVIRPDTDIIFAVLSSPKSGPLASALSKSLPTSSNQITVRLITAASAKKPELAPTITISNDATIRELHLAAAAKIGAPTTLPHDDTNECNCTLATALSKGNTSLDLVTVVHGKGKIETTKLAASNEHALMTSLRTKFGSNYDNGKKVKLIGAVFHDNDVLRYTKTPVVAICAASRHIPVGARETQPENDIATTTRVLDLHTTEMCIHPASMDTTIASSGLLDLVDKNELRIYLVVREQSQGVKSLGKSRAQIFRARPHWNPSVHQSDRGICMFLSTLRVTSSLVSDLDGPGQDAVLHVLDLLLRFPPALRTFRLLFDNTTPTFADCAALSHAVFEVLDTFMPTDMIGTDQSRLFEGARLLFGYLLDKAKAVKLREENIVLPYESAFTTLDLRDCRTSEPVQFPVQTVSGLSESAFFVTLLQPALPRDRLFNALHAEGVLDARVKRVSALSAGSHASLLIFSSSTLHSNYGYSDMGDANLILALPELQDLNHLAILSGRNKLGVYRPSQLQSATAPCLSFDRLGSVAVYTGQQGCAAPGESLLQFRPQHGEASINAAVIEQLLDPFLRSHQADGTGVFDMAGDTATKRLQQPDEVLCFVVDISASMRDPSDFVEIHDGDRPYTDPNPDIDANSLIPPSLFAPAAADLDTLKLHLCQSEGFEDMVGLLTDRKSSLGISSRPLAVQILLEERRLLGERIVMLHQRSHRRSIFGSQPNPELEKLKLFSAGLRTHEDALVDFLIYRAEVAWTTSLSTKWQWSIGDSVPPSLPTSRLPVLPVDITDIPHDIQDPISGDLIEDAVTTSDGHTYSRASLRKWFEVRHSSPMTGLPLQDTSLVTNSAINVSVNKWVEGEDIINPSCGSKTEMITISFVSRLATFSRTCSPAISLHSLYTLAFRGLKGKHPVFALAANSARLSLPKDSSTPISAFGIRSNCTVEIQVADDEPTSTDSAISNEKVLIKVWGSDDERMLYAFWVPRNVPITMESAIWKYHRWFYRTNNRFDSEISVWTNLVDIGDGYSTGYPHDSTESLSSYFNSSKCFGTLQQESVFDRSSTNIGISSPSPLVLKMQMLKVSKGKSIPRMSRLEVLKNMFEALINRLLAYDYNTHVGLVLVGSEATLSMPISHVVENFRKAVVDCQSNGDTALWDGIALARDQVNEYTAKWNSEVKKRIFVISDGQDTKSKDSTARSCAWMLRQDGIVVDSVSLGSDVNTELRAMSYFLGSYAFAPKSLASALQICELEPVLALSERPDIHTPRGVPNGRISFENYMVNNKRYAHTTVVDGDVVPPRRQDPGIDEQYVMLSSVARGQRNRGAAPRSTLRESRLLSEMRQMSTQAQHPKYDVYVSETNFGNWKIVMNGPSGTAYSEGTFVIYLTAGSTYPAHAPEMRFITKMMHPNVNCHGRICHPALSRDWVTDMSMSALINVVFGLLLQPEASDLVSTAATLDYHHDQVEFEEAVREHVSRHAIKSRAEWEVEILGADEEEEDGEGEDGEEDDGEEDDEEEDDEEEEEEWEDDEEMESDEEMQSDEDPSL